MTANEHSGHPVIVGVSPGQPPHVVLHAAQFARRFDAELICAHVNPGRYAVSEAADGAVSSAPIDPDFADLREEIFDEKLASGLSALLAESGVTWRTLVLAGDVSSALGHLAHTVDAAMIVVGAHQSSVSGTIQEFFNRSIGVQLAHHQDRPVVVIPVRTPGIESPMLWKQ
ncbi:universal stress protein [Leifsonia sp. YAF41]|uniref:universal stress protein n=1 Tax=Leifsonia sp. YAF41 TaxID=3233086 RepID=UPI003F9DAC78